ncbi:hypothetical protein AHAS_Ahas13G0332700 [Arachis hypogaea]
MVISVVCLRNPRSSNSISTIWFIVDFLIFTTANVGEKWLKWQSLNWSRLNWYSRKEKLLRTQNALEQGTLYPEKYDNTVKEFTKALDLNPVYIKALVRRGAAHEKLEHFEETIADMKKILEIDPSNDQVRKTITRLELLAAEKQEMMKR